MDIALKQRIIGALIIISAAVIVIPSILDGPVIKPQQLVLNVPPQPEVKPYKANAEKYQSLVDAVAEGIEIDQKQADVKEPEKLEAFTSKFSSVEPPRPTLTPVWTVQLGSFTQIENAKDLKNKLQTNKFRSYMKKIKTDKGITYRVYVGPDIREADATKTVQQLQKKFGLSGLVVRFKIDS